MFKKKSGIIFLLATLTINAEFSPHSLSFQGFTGLINTPNAQVMDGGEISFVYNNQFDNHLRYYNYSKLKTLTDDYIIGVGFLPNFEFQGRLKEQPGYARDLSANFKYQLPKFFHQDWIPDIAVGIQDFGSAANLYENYYIVADKMWGDFLRTSIGYGYSRNSRTQRMDGVFGGVELFLTPWLSFLGEYDGEEKHIGVRVSSLNLFSKKFSITSTIASNLSDNNDINLMVEASLKFDALNSLFDEDKKSLSMQELAVKVEEEKAFESSIIEQNEQAIEDIDFKDENSLIDELIYNLEIEGLSNITIRTDIKSSTITIEYENEIYTHNELDGMGTVLKYAVKLAKYYNNFILKPKKSNLVLYSLSGSLSIAKIAYEKPTKNHIKALAGSLWKSNSNICIGEVRVKNVNSNRFKTSILFTPILKSFIGTEVGVYDYQLLLGSQVKFHIADGLDYTFRYDIKISHSDDLDPEKGAFGYAYNDGGVFSSMLHFSSSYNRFINTLSAGLYKYNYYGIFDELTYISDNSSFGVKLGYFQHKDNSSWDHEIYLGKYTYHFSSLDLQFEIEAGKYWNRDIGYSLELKRFFEDIAVSLKYLETSPEDKWSRSEDKNKYVGVYFELPLDLKKSKTNWKHFRLGGNTAWKHGIRTTFTRDDGTNTIVVGSGEVPTMGIDHYKDFINRDRSSLDYIKEHSDRLINLDMY